jgi:glycosyltransferase involved in cell wall biosynthesis
MRFFQFLPTLSSSNVKCHVSSFFNDKDLLRKYRTSGYRTFNLLVCYLKRIWILIKSTNYDLIWIEGEALPWFPVWIEKLLLYKKPYILDYDDAIFHRYDMHRLGLVRLCYSRRIDRLMKSARLVVSGNHYLAERAQLAGAKFVTVVPTVVDICRYHFPYDCLKASAIDALPRIVWIGSPSSAKYLQVLHPILKELTKRVPFVFRIIGLDSIVMEGVLVEFMAWREESEAQLIASCDIGVMPLFDSPWEKGKCGYKLIQYMACGLPVVASDIGVNRSIVGGGKSGFLAASNEEWIARLESLLMNKPLRDSMGISGRKHVEERYCIQKIGPVMVNLFNEALGAR